MAGLEGIRSNNWGLDSKPTLKIDEVMEWTEEQIKEKWSFVYNNIMDFKLINNIK
jgi:hypothetical protein